MVRIQTVCGFGCGSSLFLKMKVEEVLKEHNLEAEIFCGDVAVYLLRVTQSLFPKNLQSVSKIVLLFP